MTTQYLKNECADLEKEVKNKQHFLDLLEIMESMVVHVSLEMHLSLFSKPNHFYRKNQSKKFCKNHVNSK
jgi:hypothetical protein